MTFADNSTTKMPLRSGRQEFDAFRISFPDERVLQVTLNRPEKLNCINKSTSREIAEIWEQFDQDESLLVGIITGVGRAFCTGADLAGGPDLSQWQLVCLKANQTRMERHE